MYEDIIQKLTIFFIKYGSIRTYLASKFAKAAQISACIAENCSCLLDDSSSQLLAP